jgi:Spy/CpxP family protein refolding chaperone
MKVKLITLTAVTVLSLGGAAFAQDQDTGGHRWQHRHGMRHDRIEKLTESLNLTPAQKTQIQPILDATKPQMEAIHSEAMEKSKAVLEDAMAKIRPLLTPDQQKQLDETKTRLSRHSWHHDGDNGDNDNG